MSICGYDESNKIIYYISAEVSPSERHLYAFDFSRGTSRRLTLGEGYYSASCNPSASHAIISYGGPEVPTQAYYKLSAESIQLQYYLEYNNNLRNLLTNFNLPKRTYVTIPVGNYTVNAYYMLPPDGPTSNLGLLLNVYGGPGSQTVTKTWSLGFNEYVASNLGIIVATVDGRGTGARGLDFLQGTYEYLGIKEAEDQVAGAKYLQNLLANRVPKNKVGIWGWSYGGFMTLHSLLAGKDIFSTGVAVAPVTDWRYYDSTYTERYMNLPDYNYWGYRNTSILNRAGNFSTPFLLIHGTGDDNVHFQNTVELNRKLIEHNIQYETMFYANSAHSITTYGARRHLYRLISNYLKRYLGN